MLAFNFVRFIFFFKQKAAYEVSRDWSSDVCSSDLAFGIRQRIERHGAVVVAACTVHRAAQLREDGIAAEHGRAVVGTPRGHKARSEERRVGKEGRSRRWQESQKKERRATTSGERSM